MDIAEAAKQVRDHLTQLFPKRHVAVTEGGRGFAVEVSRLPENEYLKEQMTSGYSAEPNLTIKIVVAPEVGAGNQFQKLTVKPALKNPELEVVGIKPIRRKRDLSPKQAVAAVIEYFDVLAGKLNKTS